MRMNGRKWMMSMLPLLAGGMLALAGCSPNPTDGKAVFQAPLLSGSTDSKDRVDLRGIIKYGDKVSDVFSTSKPLTGYEIRVNQGARLTVALTSEGQIDPVLVLYGPKDGTGIWGQKIAMDDDGKDGLNSSIQDFSLTVGGSYLIAVATFDGKGGSPFSLSVGCRGTCSEPRCPDVMCDLYCPNGFMTDPHGCELCRCIDTECASDEDCAALYPWVQPPATCVNGTCVTNQATCDDNTRCPEGFDCQMICPMCESPDSNGCPPCVGTCVPRNQVCQNDQECIFADGSQGRCINGQCVPVAQECQNDDQCPAGFICALDLCPETPPCDPTGECPPCTIGYCIPAPPTGCDDTNRCPEGFQCVMECWTNGTCAPGQTCTTDQCVGHCVPNVPPVCRVNEDCVSSDGTIGLCLGGYCLFDQIPCGDNLPPCPDGLGCMQICSACASGDPNCDTTNPECQSFCVPGIDPQCGVDADCISSAGQMGRCVQGQCIFDEIGCSTDAQCPPGFVCAIQTCMSECDPTISDVNCCFGVCVPNQPQCRVDEDCLAFGMQGRCLDGICVFDGCACPDIWDPVCGVDGFTYSNACAAQCAGVAIDHVGACESMICDDTNRCPEGYDCVMACPACDPQGSNDCGVCNGICVPSQPAACLSDVECPQGYVCQIGPCPMMPCTENDCPPCYGACVPAPSGCIETGCSGEICAPVPVNTTCIWLPEYECLRLTTCEMLQTSNGQNTCGWVQTAEYLQCLEQINNSGYCQTDEDCQQGTICQIDCSSNDGACQGRCLPSDCICPDVMDPVCGSDGIIYNNECLMVCANARPGQPGSCDASQLPGSGGETVP